MILPRRLEQELLLAELLVEGIARGREVVHLLHRGFARGELVLQRRASRARVLSLAPLQLGALQSNPLELLPRAQKLRLLLQRRRVRRSELARQWVVPLDHHAPHLLEPRHEREVLLGESLAPRLPSRELRGEPLYLQLRGHDLLLLLERGVRAGIRVLTVVLLIVLFLWGHVDGRDLATLPLVSSKLGNHAFGFWAAREEVTVGGTIRADNGVHRRGHRSRAPRGGSGSG